MREPPAEFLRRLLTDAIAAVHPAHCLPPHLDAIYPPEDRRGPLTVLAAGKAAAAMAQAVERWWPGPLTGLAVTRYGHRLPTKQIEVLEAAHPEPDAAGVAAAGRLLALARAAGPDDRLVFLLSGGASALLTLPADGITLADKQAVTRALMAAGADIGALNAVRRQLSAIKGGRLAAAAGAPIVTLAISDVVGDEPAVIGSGPTVPDTTSAEDARAVLDRFGVTAPEGVARHLAAQAAAGAQSGSATRGVYRIVAGARNALDAAMDTARAAGVHPVLHSAAVEGDARAIAAQHAHHIRTRLEQDILPRPWLLLSGGELTARVEGDGDGGPNTEYALALAMALKGAGGVHALAADTDGMDGAAGAAGALIAPDTLARADALGLDPAAHLARSDSAGFFRALGDLVETGPTHTNVNDFRAILVA